MTTFGRDLRFAIRTLFKKPGLTAISVIAFALGIGLTATAFSIIHGTLIRGLPFDQADGLVHFERQNLSEGQQSLAVTPHDYVAWREQQESFVGLAAFVEALIHMIGDAGDPERLLGVSIDRAAFDLLRVRPAIGRLFTDEESQPGGPDVIVLSHGVWSRRFGADTTIVGREVLVDNEPTTVIGVMPPEFGFPIAEQFWIPLRLDMSNVQRGGGRLDVFGRLKPGVSIEQARTEFETITRRLELAYPDSNTGITAVLQTFEQEYVGEEFTRTLYMMLLGAVLVLIISSANVTNLLLAHAAGRNHEMAVRTAVGATRWRLISLLLSEAFLLAAAGGALGILIAREGVAWFDRAGAEAGVLRLPHGTDALFWWDIQVGLVPMAFVVGVTFITTLLAGLLPALEASRANVQDVLKDEGRTTGFRLKGLTRTLVIGEVALTMGLLVVSGLMIKSVANVGRLGTDFGVDNVLTVRIDPSGPGYGDDPARLRFLNELVPALRAIPGVEAATITSSLPLTPARTASFAIEGAIYETGDDYPRVRTAAITEEFFSAFEIELVRGREFTAADGSGSAPVVIVNESFASRYFPNEDPLNKQIRLGGADSGEQWMRIVGLAPDMWMDGARDREREGLYFPLRQSVQPSARARLGRFGLRNMSAALRVNGNPMMSAGLLNEAVHQVDPTLPVYLIRPMEQVIAQGVGQYRIYGSFFMVFGGVALFLASIGLYGVMAFSVSSRTAEFGIRAALGATRADIVAGTLREGLGQVGIGITLGSALAFWLPMELSRQLYGVEPWDTSVFALVVSVLVLTGLIACLIPARRATRVDPMDALREN